MNGDDGKIQEENPRSYDPVEPLYYKGLLSQIKEVFTVTLAIEIKRFIDTFIKSQDLQRYSNYEDRLDDAVYYLTSLCKTEEEYEIVKAIVSLENH